MLAKKKTLSEKVVWQNGFPKLSTLYLIATFLTINKEKKLYCKLVESQTKDR